MEPTNIVSIDNTTIGSIVIDFVLILVNHGCIAKIGNCLKLFDCKWIKCKINTFWIFQKNIQKYVHNHFMVFNDIFSLL